MPKRSDFYFEGFSSPSWTMVPDEVFDMLMPELSNAELRVTLYIVRRTFGFKKTDDDISLRQMVQGITTKDGRVLDGGTGLSKASVARGVNGLVEKGIIEKTRNQSARKGYEATNYKLRFKGNETIPPMSQNETSHVSLVRHGLVSPADIQQRVKQDTEEKEYSKEVSPKILDDERNIILVMTRDFALELNDQAPLSNSVTRTLNLYRKSGMDIEEFTNVMYMSRRSTQAYTGIIKKGEPGNRNKMPYYFGVLEDMVVAYKGVVSQQLQE